MGLPKQAAHRQGWLKPNWELTQAAATHLASLHAEAVHVKGHVLEARTRAKELNTIADDLASTPDNRFIELDPPGFSALFFIQNKIVNTKLASKIRHAATTLDLTLYSSAHGWSHWTMERLNWEAYGTAI